MNNHFLKTGFVFLLGAFVSTATMAHITIDNQCSHAKEVRIERMLFQASDCYGPVEIRPLDGKPISIAGNLKDGHGNACLLNVMTNDDQGHSCQNVKDGDHLEFKYEIDHSGMHPRNGPCACSIKPGK